MDGGAVLVAQQRPVLPGDQVSATWRQHQRVGGDQPRRRPDRLADAQLVAEVHARGAAAIVRGRGFALRAGPLCALRAVAGLAAPVVAVEQRQKGAIGRSGRGRGQFELEDLRHLPLGLAARAREGHGHGGADRIGGDDDVAGLARQHLKQRLAGGVEGLRQGADLLPEGGGGMDRDKGKGCEHGPAANGSRVHDVLRNRFSSARLAIGQWGNKAVGSKQ